jgi:protein-S-isoprenylcysteine O-methyltransferase Ste14
VTDLIALITIMLWPVVPLFWIPVHGFPKISKKIGLLTYVISLLTWLPVAYLIYCERSFLLYHKIAFPTFIIVAGIVLLSAGTLLHVWTGKLLSISGLIGIPEISSESKGRFVAAGPFSVVRHPTYLAHTMMFLGVFLMTGVIAAGIITVIDLLVVNAVVIPLEEKELLIRFGDEYNRYKDKVPRFFPGIKFPE